MRTFKAAYRWHASVYVTSDDLVVVAYLHRTSRFLFAVRLCQFAYGPHVPVKRILTTEGDVAVWAAHLRLLQVYGVDMLCEAVRS